MTTVVVIATVQPNMSKQAACSLHLEHPRACPQLGAGPPNTLVRICRRPSCMDVCCSRLSLPARVRDLSTPLFLRSPWPSPRPVLMLSSMQQLGVQFRHAGCRPVASASRHVASSEALGRRLSAKPYLADNMRRTGRLSCQLGVLAQGRGYSLCWFGRREFNSCFLLAECIIN